MACCSICLEDIRSKTNVDGFTILPKNAKYSVLKCNHIFHTKCLKKWFYKKGVSASCPVCRGHMFIPKATSLYVCMILYKLKDGLYLEDEDSYLVLCSDYDYVLFETFPEKASNAPHAQGAHPSLPFFQHASGYKDTYHTQKKWT